MHACSPLHACASYIPQALISAGIKGLEEMVLQRFTDMAEREKADEQPLLAAGGGNPNSNTNPNPNPNPNPSTNPNLEPEP